VRRFGGSKFQVPLVGVLLALLGLTSNSNAAMPDSVIFSANPLETLPRATVGGEEWTGIAMNEDATHIALSMGEGFLYTSTNSGKTWNRSWSQSSRSNEVWSTNDKTVLAMSATGQFIGYADDSQDQVGGQISISRDSGQNWKIASSMKEQIWQGISCSPSGKYWAALSMGDGSGNSNPSNPSKSSLFLSSDFGATWHVSNSLKVSSGLSSGPSIRISNKGQLALVDSVGLHLSSDFGGTWSNPQIGVNHVSVTAVSFTGDTSRLVVATGNQLFYSSNFGGTWEQSKYPGFHDVISLSPGTSPTIVNGIDRSSSLRVLQSMDSGVTWKMLGMSKTISTKKIPAMSASAQKLIVTDGRDVLTSMDSGRSWTPITGEMSRLWTTAYWSENGKTIVTTSRHPIYLEGEDFNSDLFTSNDAGKNWTGFGSDNVQSPSEGQREFGQGIEVVGPKYDIGKYGLIYAMEPSTTHYIFKSLDGGNSWKSVLPDIVTRSAADSPIVQGSFTSTADGKISLFLTTPNKLWVTHDQGSHWTQRAIPISGSTSDLTGLQVDGNGQELVTYAQGNLLISNDQGVTWAKHPLTLPLPVRDLIMSKDGRVISILIGFSGSRTIYESTDGGNSWRTSNIPGGDNANSLSMSTTGKYQVILNGKGTDFRDYTGYINFSSDYGKTWNANVGAGLSEWTNVALSPDGSKILAAGDGAVSGSQYSDLYLSTDFGKNWSDISQTATVVWGKSPTGK